MSKTSRLNIARRRLNAAMKIYQENSSKSKKGTSGYRKPGSFKLKT